MSSTITQELDTCAGNHAATGLKNILFATDFSAPSMKAFPYVIALAKKFGASVFASHVISNFPCGCGAAGCFLCL
jgi:hypothetical protein